MNSNLRFRPSVAKSARSRKNLPALCLLVLLFPCSTTAQDTPQAPASADERETIKELLKRIEALETRLKQLESVPAKPALKLAPPSAGVPAPAPPTVPDQQRSETQPGVEAVAVTGPSLQIRGFADMEYRASDLTGSKNSLALGQLDLFFNSRLSDKLSVFGELVFEAGHDNVFAVDLERILLQYAVRDYLNVSFGRYHTAIGFYNTAYHHGEWLATAAGRPFIFNFEDEGGILPIHNVGLEVSGRIPSRGLGLRYLAEVGNGRAARSPLDQAVQNKVDENNGKAFNIALLARPDPWPGFQTGFSVYRDELTPLGSPTIGETIFATHLVYQRPNLEFLNEALLIRHSPEGRGRSFNTVAFYTQISRQFGRYRPYFRYQYVNAADSEPIFSDVRRRNGPSLGLRLDLGEFAAIKFQYDRTDRRAQSSINELLVQFAFTF